MNRNTIDEDQLDDEVYVNLEMTYDGGDVNNQALVLAKKSITRTNPYLIKPSAYYLSIVRFQINLFDAPLAIPLIQTNQSNINLTPYSFQLGYNGTYSDQSFVIYFPTNQFERVPTSPVGSMQDLSTGYYYIYDYRTLVTMLNNALSAALTNLNGKIATGVTEAPQFYYDQTLGIVLRAIKTGYKYTVNPSFTTDAGFIQVYTNSLTYSFVNGMQVQVLNNNQPCSWAFGMYNQYNNSDSTDNYWLVQQQVGQTELNNIPSIQTLQIQTTMPVQSEYSSGPVGALSVLSNQQFSQTTAILTDITIDNTNSTAYHGTIIYNRVDSLRVYPMVSNSPLFNVNAQIFFTDAYNRVYPLLISQGINCSIKLQFIKKSVYNGIKNIKI
jgi:hypothetical protein